MLLQVLLSLLGAIFGYYWYHYKRLHYRFDAAGLKYLPGVPIFGNVWKSTLLKRHFVHDLDEAYNAFPDDKYIGFAEGIVPVILVRDPELMKTIVIKDFDHFQNRKEFFPVRLDPLLGRNVLQLQDNEWKTMRTKLTPAFTASRLRYMLPAMVNVSKNIVKSLRNYPSKEVNLAESMYRYSGDVVAAAAFGFNQDTAGQENSVFYQMCSTIYLNFWRRVLIFISMQYPNLSETIKSITGLQLFPKKSYDFLRKAVLEAMDYRNSNHLAILDYMDVLKEAAQGRSIDDLAGQVFFSIMASSESGSGTLRFCFHELALNPEIQERLYQEIKRHEESGQMTMESINRLQYLDCVLKEVSRRWPAAVMMDRICTKPYLLPPPREGGKHYLVKPGDMVINVVNSVQLDPKYHPDPEVFDPERFSDENKHKIKSFTFMPFGMGPRSCLGVRFAILSMKVMIYQMLLNFRLVRCEKTADPIHLEPDEMNMRVLGGTWLRLESRT